MGAATGVAVDSSGNVYFANNTVSNSTGETVGTINEISAGSSSHTLTAFTTASGSYLSGVAVDNSGNIYFAEITINTNIENPSGGAIKEIAAGSHTVSTLATTAANLLLAGVAVDTTGNVYFASNKTLTPLPAHLMRLQQAATR